MKVLRALGVALAVAVASTAASAQVTVSPGEQTLTLGSETGEFVISATGVADTASLFGFVIQYDPETDPYEPVAAEDGSVTCTVEEDLAATVAPLAFFFPDRDPGQFRISFGDQVFPLANFSRDGVIGRCPVRLKDGVTAGTFTLPCGSGASASSATGTAVEITCEPGTLTIVDATATPTTTPTPEAPTVTNTPAATNTSAASPTNTRRVGGGGEEDDGCHMAAPADASTGGWLLLVPAALLIWRRRRAQ